MSLGRFYTFPNGNHDIGRLGEYDNEDYMNDWNILTIYTTFESRHVIEKWM